MHCSIFSFPQGCMNFSRQKWFFYLGGVTVPETNTISRQQQSVSRPRCLNGGAGVMFLSISLHNVYVHAVLVCREAVEAHNVAIVIGSAFMSTWRSAAPSHSSLSLTCFYLSSGTMPLCSPTQCGGDPSWEPVYLYCVLIWGSKGGGGIQFLITLDRYAS